MQTQIFWAIRYTVVGLSLFCSLGCAATILRKRLQHRLLMKYVLLMSLCEALMAMSALLFTDKFIDLGGRRLTTEQPWLILSQLQGFVFRAAELTTFALTLCITFAVYCATKGQLDMLKRYNSRILLAALLLPSTVMLPTIFYIGNGPCNHGDIFFNCVCNNSEQPGWYFILNWVVPCCIIMAATFACMGRICRLNLKLGHFNSLTSYRQAILVYRIPPINFVVLLINLAVTFTTDLSADDSVNTLLFLINLLVFMMPLVCVMVLALYLRSAYTLSQHQESLVTEADVR